MIKSKYMEYVSNHIFYVVFSFFESFILWAKNYFDHTFLNSLKNIQKHLNKSTLQLELQWSDEMK